eukprot:gene1771-biopygen10334
MHGEGFASVIDKMAGAQYWTTLDAASAYWSIPLADSDKEETAFLVPHCKYKFNVMPYGLSNAYMDDIVIFNSTSQEHIEDLTAIFDRLRSANL